MSEEKTFKCAFCGTEQTEAGKILKEGSRPPTKTADKEKKKKEKPGKKASHEVTTTPKKSIWD